MPHTRILILVVALFLVPRSAHAATVDLTKPTFGGTVEFWALPEEPDVEPVKFLKSTCGPACPAKREEGGRRCIEIGDHGHCFWLELELRPVSDAQARFVRWTGCPMQTGASCFVDGGNPPLTPVRAVHAVFEDVGAPTGVTITTVSPCPCKGNVTLRATATDNVGVTGVEFLAGTVSLGTDPTAPYEWTFNSASHPTGSLTVKARASDAAHNTTEASAQIAIDNTPPTIIIDGPTLDPGTPSHNPSFTFTAGDATTVTCSLDSAAYTPCTSPKSFTNVADGVHTLHIRAGDVLGNIGQRDHAFKVDSFGPVVTIPGAPTNPVLTRNTTPSFEFTTEPAKTLECRIDSGPYVPCTSKYTVPVPLADGAHILTVRATDVLGNVNEKTHAFTIDTVAPDTRLTAAPADGRRTRDRNARFEFDASETTASFTCSLDGATAQACTSPKSFTTLAEGPHTVVIRATDGAGNADSTPATRAWTVDVTEPVFDVVAGPAADPGTADRAPEFRFRTGDAVTIECALDTETAYGPCGTPVSHQFSGLADGAHTLYLRGVDEAGNPGRLAHAFLIDTTPPETEITDGTMDGAQTSERAARFEFRSETGATLSCRLDGVPLAACASPVRLDGLAAGVHSFEVLATDRVGNTDPTPAARTWTVVGGVVGLVRDTDGDGFPDDVDCRPADPRISPGARDIPGNLADEDCKDGPRAYDRVRASARVAWSYLGKRLRVTQLLVVDAAKGTRIEVRCAGRSCPIRTKRVTATRAGRVVLTTLLKGRWLRPGTRLTVSLSAPEAIGRRVELTVAPNGHRFTRVERCLAVGTARVIAC